jgi:hypothetical protein
MSVESSVIFSTPTHTHTHIRTCNTDGQSCAIRTISTSNLTGASESTTFMIACLVHMPECTLLIPGDSWDFHSRRNQG